MSKTRLLIVLGIVAAVGAAMLIPWNRDKRFISQEGGFLTEFPSRPTEKKMKAPNGETTMYLVMGNDRLSHAVSWIALSLEAPNVEAYLDETATAFAAQPMIEKVKSQTKKPLDKHPGRQMSAESAMGEMRVHWYFANGRLYQIMLSGPPSAVHSKKGDRFFDSFGVLP